MIKKIISAIISLSILITFAGCSNSSSTASLNSNTDSTGSSTVSSAESKNLKVGFCPGPYSDLWKTAIAHQLEEKG